MAQRDYDTSPKSTANVQSDGEHELGPLSPLLEPQLLHHLSSQTKDDPGAKTQP